MWQSKGRSGYGDSAIGSGYHSWDGLSPNGRQYKNEATMETRDLSGADYWHLRKQNRPTEEIPLELHMLNKDKANINAYADKPVQKRNTSVPLIDRVLPQQRRVRVLTEQLYELEAERKKGLDINTYSQLRDILIIKRDRAELLLQKALSVKPIREETDEDDVEIYAPIHDMAQDDDGCKDEPFAWLSSENSLKKPLKIACTITRTLVRWSQQAAAYYRTLKEV